MFRTVVPIVKKGSTALGQELLKSGVGVAEDIWKTGDLKYAQKRRGKELISNISNRVSNHMFGSGYTSHLGGYRGQLKRATRRRKVSKVKKGKVGKKRVTKRKSTKKAKAKPRQRKRKTVRTKQDFDHLFSKL